MTSLLNPPFTPRNGSTLMVLSIARISTINQDRQSLADQQALHQQWLAERYSGPTHFDAVATQGSGEWLDRKEVFDIQNKVASRRYDLVILEDLARYMRDYDAVGLCRQCCDHETRLVAINDFLDTAYENWEDGAIFASMRHKKYNEDTSRRIKRSANERFLRNGQGFQFAIYGYIKPPDCRSDADVRKDPAAGPIYDEWFRKLEAGASYAEVADWLHAMGVPLGQYCKSTRWTGKMVGRITENTILKGLRFRNRHHSVKHLGSGRRKSRKASPEMLKTRDCPHLAHIDPDRYDRVITMLKLRNAQYRRKPLANGNDPLLHRPRKRSAWPGQHCHCGICGRMLVYGAHGQNHHLVCSGAADYKCWNAITFDGCLGRRQLTAAIIQAIESLPEFDGHFRHQVEEALKQRHGDYCAQFNAIETKLQKIERQIDNVVQFIANGSGSTALSTKLIELEAEKKAAQFQRNDLQRSKNEKRRQFLSIEQIKAAMHQALNDLPHDGPDFARLMKSLINRIVVRPYHMIDGSRPVLRAKFLLNLSPLAAIPSELSIADHILCQELEVDLFESPQREMIRRPLLELLKTSPDRNLKRLAAGLPVKVTTTAVQRSLTLIRLMDERGLTDPYEPITDPDRASHLSRHRHARYCFEPLQEQPAPTDAQNDCIRVA